MQKILSLSIFLMLLAGWSCTQEDDATTVVATEEVIFVSGDKVRVLGRLITNQPIAAEDHGFYLSTSDDFSNPVIISLGPKEGPGRFIGETAGLQIKQSYVVKAFVKVNGVDLFGEVLELNTLSPVIESFSPAFSVPGQELIIEGRNLPEGTKVFFGNQEATVLENVFESKIRVRIPASSGQSKVTIRLQFQDQDLEFSQLFEYQSGKYTLLGQFPGGVRIYENVSFQNKDGFFAGLGVQRLAGYYPGFQRFNPQTGTWSEVSFPGTPVEAAFATANYLGGGAIQIDRDVFDYNREFWKINGSSFERLPDLPFNSFQSLAFEINGNLFLAGGVGVGSRGIKRYNPQTKTWNSLGLSPIDLDYRNPLFIYQNQVYFIATDGDIWEYNPNADTWRFFTRYPDPQGNGFGMAQVLGDKVYIGLFRRTDKVWELDLKTLTWKTKNNIPGLPQSVNVGIFTFDGQIYILRAPEVSVGGNLPMELYRFEPDAI